MTTEGCVEKQLVSPLQSPYDEAHEPTFPTQRPRASGQHITIKYELTIKISKQLADTSKKKENETDKQKQ